MPDIYDCAIVGDGPAGLSAAVNLLQRGRTCVVLGLGKSYLQKAELVDNYLGLPAMTGSEMYNAFVQHAKTAGAEIRHAKVNNIVPFGEQFMLNADGDIITSRTVMLAMGAAKAAAIPGEAELLGKGVSYCATCDGMLYRGKDVAVWALGEDALQEAAFLYSIGCRVTVIAAKEPSGLPEGIRVIQGRIEKVNGEQQVTSITVNGSELAVQGVFILRDAIAPGALINGLDMNNGRISANENGETNLPGVYAVGDLSGKPLQVAKAVGDALRAALHIAEALK